MASDPREEERYLTSRFVGLGAEPPDDVRYLIDPLVTFLRIGVVDPLFRAVEY